METFLEIESVFLSHFYFKRQSDHVVVDLFVAFFIKLYFGV